MHPGEVLDYRVHAPGGPDRDVQVVVAAHRDWWATVREVQPDAALVSFLALGLAVWLVRRRPDQHAAYAFLLYAAGWASDPLVSWSSPQPLDLAARPWLVAWSTLTLSGYVLSGLATLLFALSFPSVPRRAGRAPLTALAVVPPVLCAALAASYLAGAAAAGGMLNAFAEALWQLLTLSALVVVAVRWWRLRRDREARRRIQLVVLGFAASFLLILVGKWVQVPAGTFGFGLVLLLFPLSLVVAVATRDLYELDVVLNRSLVWALSGAALLGLYLGAAYAVAELTGKSGPLVSLPAAGLVAVALAPVRDRVSRLVAARLFGTGGDTQVVLHRLGMRLEASGDPETLLAAVVDTAAEGLRLPYVAVELREADGQTSIAVSRGRRTSPVEEFPIVIEGVGVGRLVAAPRRDTAGLSPVDRGLLTDLARHCGVAARAVALLTELRRAQQTLLVAREQERHRIHRDLHDGLGPALVGLTLQLEVASELAEGQSELSRLLGRLHREAARGAQDVRRLVRDLRPAELEELGLPAAVAAAADRLRAPSAPEFAIEAPPRLPGLPAEVEDAAYKTCLEAMTNVLRHSGARRCWVRLGSDGGTLAVEVLDDGRGLPDAAVSSGGTGLRSMQERAGALGGELSLTGRVGGGTRVVLRLPLDRTPGAPATHPRARCPRDEPGCSRRQRPDPGADRGRPPDRARRAAAGAGPTAGLGGRRRGRGRPAGGAAGTRDPAARRHRRPRHAGALRDPGHRRARPRAARMPLPRAHPA